MTLHRDIKPDNIFVTKRGTAKILDFGLAKLMAERQLSPEASTVVLSRPGMVLGTVAYMSPEQALGAEIDARSDVFSFGVVLYEMSTGKLPFQGATSAAIFDAILHADPVPPSRVNPHIPFQLEHIIAKALEKDRNLRYQTASDIRADLARLKRDSQSHSVGQMGSARTAWRTKAALAVAALIMAVAVTAVVLRTRHHSAGSRLDLSYMQLTDLAGPENFPSLAADGRSFLYAAYASGNWDIYLQRVGGTNPVNLTKDSSADDTQPAFSPDSEHIAFRSARDGGGIFVMGATGESVRRLTSIGFNPAWSPDGREIVFSTDEADNPANRLSVGQIWVVNVSTGEKHQLANPQTVPDAVQPNWSPHGYRIAYWGNRGGQRDIWTISSDGTHPVEVTRDAALDWSPVWSPNGEYLYFSSDRSGSMNLWRVWIDEKSGSVLAPPEPVTTPSPYSGPLSIRGNRIAYVQRLTTANIQKARFDAVKETVVARPEWITEGSRQARYPQLSPNGEWLVFWDWGKQEDIFVIRTDGTGLRHLTNDPYRDRHARWSPDGRRIAFTSNRAGRYDLWLINPDGSGLERLTYTEGAMVNYAIWSPDGKRLAYTKNGRVFIMEIGKPWQEQSDSAIAPPPELSGGFYVWSWSPDGRKLAGVLWTTQITPNGFGIYAMDSRKLERVASFGGRMGPVWLKDSRRLLLQHNGKLYVLDTDSRNVREIFSVVPHSIDPPALSADNSLMYFSVVTTEADIWLASMP